MAAAILNHSTTLAAVVRVIGWQAAYWCIRCQWLCLEGKYFTTLNHIQDI